MLTQREQQEAHDAADHPAHNGAGFALGPGRRRGRRLRERRPARPRAHQIYLVHACATGKQASNYPHCEWDDSSRGCVLDASMKARWQVVGGVD